MSRSLDECEHGTASGHCSYCQEVDELRKKLAIAKGTLKFYAGYSSIGDCARDALAELDGEAK